MKVVFCLYSVRSQRSGAAKERGGRWVETEDGMEWEPSDSADDQSLPGSQESVRSNARNPEAGLTAEEKTEMKESRLRTTG